jgi:hypothetical protein
MARLELARFFETANKEAAAIGQVAMYPEKFTDGWSCFSMNPQLDTAIVFIGNAGPLAPMLFDYFVNCCPGGLFHTMNGLARPRAIDSALPEAPDSATQMLWDRDEIEEEQPLRGERPAESMTGSNEAIPSLKGNLGAGNEDAARNTRRNRIGRWAMLAAVICAALWRAPVWERGLAALLAFFVIGCVVQFFAIREERR